MYGTAISREVGTSLDQHYHLSLFGQGSEGRPHLFITTVNGTDILGSAGAPDPVPQRTWTHMAGTYDGATVRLYVNGAEISNMAMPLTGDFAVDTTPLIIGGNGNDASGVPTELFPGRIDELMLYARALSAAEIGQLFAGALFPRGATDAGAD
jgi:Concanavalin A-like lectin/glucanases superfamily